MAISTYLSDEVTLFNVLPRREFLLGLNRRQAIFLKVIQHARAFDFIPRAMRNISSSTRKCWTRTTRLSPGSKALRDQSD